jgi:hypothetical protein
MSTDTGGCHFYRLRTPLMALRALGHVTSWDTCVDADTLNEADVLVAQFINGEQDVEAWETIARAPRRPLMVYEVDDDLFSIHHVITSEVSKKEVIWARPDTQERVQRAMKVADLVTVTNEHLASLYAPYAQSVAILPNAVPDWLLNLPAPTEPLDRFTLGWTCSHSHLLDARAHFPELLKFMHINTDTRFEWFGPPKAVAFPPWQQRCTPWVGDVNEYLRMMPGRMHVGIAPLGDFPFNLGKSGIKADEYLCFGAVPVVSDFPQYRDVIEHGTTGYLVKRPGQWLTYLRELKHEPAMRAEMLAAGRAAVAGRTISKVAHRWTDAYHTAITGR